MLPKIPYKMSKNKRQTTSFRGINYSNVTSEGDIADSKNISARAYPYLTTRKGRERVDHLISCNGKLLENVSGITRFGEGYAVVADGKFYYDGQPIGELTPGEKQFAAVNTKLCIMPDKKYFDLQTGTLEDMGGKASGLAVFGDASESGMTDSITISSTYRKIGEGYGICQIDGEMTLSRTQELHNGPIAVVDLETTKSAMFFCDDLGKATLTMSVYDSKWHFSVNWITKNDDATSFAEGDILILGDGAVYIVDSVVSSIFLEVRRWNGYWWYGYDPTPGDITDGWSPYGTETFDHHNVRVCRAITLSDKKGEIDRIGALYSEDLGGVVRGSTYVNGFSTDEMEGKAIFLYEKRDSVILDGVVTSVGWPSDTDLSELTEGTRIVFRVEGYADEPAVVESVSTYATGAAINCPFPWPTFVPLSEDADDPWCSKVEILIFDESAEPLVLSECFKIGDCVTVTGDSQNQENNLSFVISDIVDNTLYASSDIFAAGSQNVTIERRVPDMDFVCESGNRLWGCSNANNTIYVSALGDPTNFFVNSAISTDSFAVAVGSEGKFTACCRYGSDVLFWKETKLHKVIGSYPAEYTIYSYDIEGVQAGCEKSPAVINEVLYYKGIHGVYAFTSSPTLISSNFGERYFTDAVAGADGDSYYLSAKDDDGRSYLFVYETLLGMWILEDDVRALNFVRNGKDLYMRTEDGKFYLCGASDTETDMEWLVQLTPFYETLEGSKTYSRLLLRVELPRGSYLRVEVRTDGGAWREAGKIIGRSCEVVPIRVPINRCDKFEIRLSGKGKCTVLSMMREFYVNSDK